ncbi:hypothetical protein OEIGOIKO_05732 [Streptomyces chrestomyceticus JCM 4735]|uniref:Uncharacterized protein n=1 Tax=Streptomyces chrestomyceticus JCM 4735 TaxID=1306181 RepID=A0A7U9L016_9ACTN|nr:hypothetical protein [Streptomyces chrestomyceticus]GCD37922.1 hypothetical protein OEIGOIKO_05732 [Streptomyces chrestomyceticus JCM 4735]
MKRRSVPEAAAEIAEDEGVYTLYLTHQEALAVWCCLDDTARNAEALHALRRLAALLNKD